MEGPARNLGSSGEAEGKLAPEKVLADRLGREFDVVAEHDMGRAQKVAPLRGAEDPLRRRWTREEYLRLAEVGILGPDERVELIDGEVVRKVTPQKAAHATAIRKVEGALRGLLPSQFLINVQLPLALGRFDQPEPDVSVVEGAVGDFADDILGGPS